MPLATTWFSIVGICLILWNLDLKSNYFVFSILILASTFLTLLVHRLLLLIHEGAHLQFAKKRNLNDLISNIFAGVFLGTEVGSYRKIHTLHHRNLGNPSDPENSYENEFDFTWLLTVFSGLHTLKTLKRRDDRSNSRSQLLTSICTVIIHGSIIFYGLHSGEYLFISAWIASWFLLMPALTATRNLIEHRFSDSAMHFEIQKSLKGFSNSTTRIFTLDRKSRMLGSVGFDRHLIHHWDPSISAKDLEQVHRFLLTTELASMLKDMPTTYFAAAKSLWKKI